MKQINRSPVFLLEVVLTASAMSLGALHVEVVVAKAGKPERVIV